MAQTRLDTEDLTYGNRADSRMWRKGAWLAAALLALYLVVPLKYEAMHAVVIYQACDLLALGMILYGVRRYRPRVPVAWLLIAGATAAFAVADLLVGLYDLAGEVPFPSVADLFYLLGYPLFAIGLIVASRAKFPKGERGAFIDGGIVTINAALFAGLLVASQASAHEELTPLGTLVASAYPIADVLLLSVAVRFLLSVTRRPLALRMLALGLALTLVGDVMYSAYGLFTVGAERSLAEGLLLAGALCIGLAGLHPSMKELTTENVGATISRYSVSRVVSLYVISLIPVAVLAYQALTGDTEYVWITLVALVAVAGLVIWRFVDLVGRTLRAADRQATISRLHSELLATNGRDEILAAGQRAIDGLVPGGSARVVEGSAELAAQGSLFTSTLEADGKVIGFVVADENVTAAEGTHDALDTVARALSITLEWAILEAEQRANADRLVEQNAQLVELDRMKDQLVSSVSHELRTPLTSIGGYTEMLLDDEFGDLNDEQREFVEVVNRNAKRLNRIIDDILFAARVDAGKLSLERTWIDLIEVARASVTAARPRAETGGVTIELVVPDSFEPMFADHTRITQMFDNLISNGVKFTQPGGTVTVTLTGSRDTVSVAVADTGMGIPKDEVDRLFEKFFRTSTVGTVEGTGLGLSIVKSIVEVHDGTIAVVSIEGTGTTFTVDLPYRPTAIHDQEVAK